MASWGRMERIVELSTLVFSFRISLFRRHTLLDMFLFFVIVDHFFMYLFSVIIV